MKLDRKKLLAVNALGVGKKRILFNNASLGEIKEAITRQDIRDLLAAGAITIKQARGKAKEKGIKRKRGAGKVKKRGGVDLKTYGSIRRRIRAKMFRDMRHLKDYIKQAL